MNAHSITENLFAEEEEKCSDTGAEFLRMACALNATAVSRARSTSHVIQQKEFLRLACALNATTISQAKSKEKVIRKEKTRRQYRRPKHKSINKVPDGLKAQWMSETPSSSAEEDSEQSDSDGVSELGNLEKAGSLYIQRNC